MVVGQDMATVHEFVHVNELKKHGIYGNIIRSTYGKRVDGENKDEYDRMINDWYGSWVHYAEYNAYRETFKFTDSKYYFEVDF